jgi:hypothetical protein
VGTRQGLDREEHDGRDEGDGLFPQAVIARFYGTAQIVRSGPVYEEVWRRLVQPEKDRDPEKKGYAVLIKVERAEDLEGLPLEG